MGSMRTIEQIAGIGSWEMALPSRAMTWSASACELLFAQAAQAATSMSLGCKVSVFKRRAMAGLWLDSTRCSLVPSASTS